MADHDGSSNQDRRDGDPRSERSAFESLNERLRRGDSGAMQQLFDEYSQKLVRLAGKNIHPALVKRFDGEDVVQSVFRTFFRRQEEGRFQIEHSQQLWKLLVTITLCKTRSHARRHTADCRDAKADKPLVDDGQLLGRQPSHEDALALWEEIDAVLDGLPERTGEILSMHLEGRGKTEIASELSLSRQTIHRVLKLMEKRLQERSERFSEDDLRES